MDPVTLLLPLLSGAAGGNIVGGVMKRFNLGSLGNTLAGLIGGGVGAPVLAYILSSGSSATGADTDMSLLLPQILGGAIGGGALTVAVALLSKTFHRHG